MPLLLRDSLSGRDRTIHRNPRRPLRMYICGPTVYAPAHVGHARTYLFFDVLRRAIEAAGIPLRHAMNITDVEDKIFARAADLGLDWRSLARREERNFWADMRRLEVLPPDVAPRSSEHLDDIRGVVRALERRGRVVQRTDAAYYRPPRKPDPRNFPVGEAFAEHAVPEPGIDSTADSDEAREFVVWKRQAPPAPSWASPWGAGVPGWHLECYAMAEHHLGLPVDLHGGGVDLIFPHHYAENELALTLTNQRFAGCYLHTGFVTEGGAKMSKSRGGLVTIRDTVAEFGRETLRWYLLALPYNLSVEWNPLEAERARNEWMRLREVCRASLPHGAGGGVPIRELKRLVDDVHADILNRLGTNRAYDRLRGWLYRLDLAPDGRLPRGSLREARALYARLDRLLALGLS
jgi:cysteinyl-tRNA synthetase